MEKAVDEASLASSLLYLCMSLYTVGSDSLFCPTRGRFLQLISTLGTKAL